MVEWNILGNLCEIGTGSNNREDACDNGLYPFFVRSKEVLRIDSYLYDEEAVLIPGEGGVGDIFHYINGKYGLHQRTYRVHPISTKVSGRYLFYYLSGNFKSYINSKSYKATAASIRKPMLIDFPIALPVVEEQKYYRDKLLDLEGKEGVEMKILGEVCEIKGRIGFRGYTREDQVSKGEGALTLTATNIINQRIDYNNNTYITWEKYYESPEIMVQNGDIIVCQRGSIGKIAFVEDLIEKATINPQLLLIKNIKILNRFLSYYLLSRFFQNDLSQIIGHGTVQMIAQKDFKNLVVPVPSLSEQQRIVDILDKFEASIQNLEAQLSQREKQYEYYRNKLLTFE